MSDLNITFIVGTPGGGTSLVAELINRSGAFGGTVKPDGRHGYAENHQISNRCVVPYIRRFFPGRKRPNGQKQLLPERTPIPFAEGENFYQPPNFRELILEIFKREGWDGTTPLFFKRPKTVLMSPVFHKAFPEAKWIIVRRNEQDTIKTIRRREWVPFPKSINPNNLQHDPAASMFRRSLDATHNEPSVNSIEVSYDELIEGNFLSIKKAIEFAGLEYNEEMVQELVIPKDKKTTIDPYEPFRKNILRPVEIHRAKKLRIICVYKTGGIYTADDVLNLKRLVDKTITVEHEFVCYSDDPAVADVSLKYDLQGWWSKIEIFRETGNCLYLDLDTFLLPGSNALAKTINRRGPGELFAMLHNNVRKDSPHWYGGGVMAWRGDFSYLLAELYFENLKPTAPDDLYISKKLKERKIKPYTVDRIIRGVYSWPLHCAPNGNKVPDDAALVYFNRKPKPRDLGAPYFIKN